jgi:transposase
MVIQTVSIQLLELLQVEEKIRELEQQIKANDIKIDRLNLIKEILKSKTNSL